MLLLMAMTTLEKLQAVPQRFWINVLLIIAGGVLALILVRHAARMNKYVLGLLIFLFVSTVGFQWIYERNEPRVLTPVVDVLAQFLPTKGFYQSR
ncbi:hypothetical protein [Actomonas aquatica]|uniref:Uncharacterized protein n=1 Tax=Actomonas aquatica TaxID=2866162 RepID=A0ABZ1C3Q5_9BACT|nr:hypothetical protein [Opitutus sp. WL0086]WRQ86194.1 hypothetical protein K1X11_015370 [Opitutus sp. WL0086]